MSADHGHRDLLLRRDRFWHTRRTKRLTISITVRPPAFIISPDASVTSAISGVVTHKWDCVDLFLSSLGDCWQGCAQQLISLEVNGMYQAFDWENVSSGCTDGGTSSSLYYYSSTITDKRGLFSYSLDTVSTGEVVYRYKEQVRLPYPVRCASPSTDFCYSDVVYFEVTKVDDRKVRHDILPSN